MKRIFSLCAVAALGIALLPSCKKTTNNTRPTSNNLRIVGYTVIDSIHLSGKDTSYTTNDTYRFFFDASKRVTKVIHTGNDFYNPNREWSFIYKSDSVFKTISPAGATSVILERDTFILNSDGLIKTAYTQDANLYYGMMTNYDYYQGLLATEELVARDLNGTVSASVTYTSREGDFLRRNFNNVVTAKFDKLVAPPNTISYSLDSVFWYTADYQQLLMKHSHVGSLADAFTSYKGQAIHVIGRDVWGNIDTLYFPGVWYDQVYTFCRATDSMNRPGDYLQVPSYTTYGMNLYRNDHLVRQISTQGRTTKMSYNIDAESKVKQMFVTVKDSVLNTHTMKYDFQYEVF